MGILSGLLLLCASLNAFANAETARPVVATSSIPTRPVEKESPPPAPAKEARTDIKLSVPALALGSVRFEPKVAGVTTWGVNFKLPL